MQPNAPKRIFDIARPGTTPAHANSKPVLKSRLTSHVDPTITKKESPRTTTARPMPRRIALDASSTFSEPRPLRVAEPVGLPQQTPANMQQTSRKQPVTRSTPSAHELQAQKLLQQPALKAKKSSKKRKIIVSILVVLVTAMVVYDVMLVMEYLQLT